MTAQSLLNEVGTAYAEKHNCDVLIYTGPTYDPSDVTVIDLVTARRRRRNLLFYLQTEGGSPDCAYRIARCLQERYSQEKAKISVYVNGSCKSAGTLMALVAHELVMTDHSELGPLDIQTLERDEIGEYSSGLKPIEALQGARSEAAKIYEEFFTKLRIRSKYRFPTKLAAEVATNISVGLASELYQQIDPLRLAETTRAMRIMEEYAERIRSSNVKDRTIAKLVAAYPDHGFVIDRREAQTLFENVRTPSDEEVEICTNTDESDEMQSLSRRNGAIVLYLCAEPSAHIAEVKPGDAKASQSTREDRRATTVTPNGDRNQPIEQQDGQAVGGR